MSINEKMAEWRDTSPDYIKPSVEFKETNKSTEFIKFDTDKPKYHLIQPYWYEDTAKVMTMGANKYAEDNWKLNQDINRYISSLERHLSEIKKGNYFDDESGLQHTAHTACNSMFLHYMIRNKND